MSETGASGGAVGPGEGDGVVGRACPAPPDSALTTPTALQCGQRTCFPNIADCTRLGFPHAGHWWRTVPAGPGCGVDGRAVSGDEPGRAAGMVGRVRLGVRGTTLWHRGQETCRAFGSAGTGIDSPHRHAIVRDIPSSSAAPRVVRVNRIVRRC
ncbi:MAG: hypothetical protein HY720_00085 [Planctomycetes bacterium]|nr:hypothetical protein [Planctomycetota bacterium]